jgi:putative transposase
MNSSESQYYNRSHHFPSHLFSPNKMYMVTGATYRKVPIFDNAEKLDFLLGSLFLEAETFGWNLQAWAIMPNHYHFIAGAPEEPLTLRAMIRSLHSKSARWLNQQDEKSGRKVWFQYWDSCLTYENSYLARLNYVHHNPVKHGLVQNAENYKWCSMNWFSQNADKKYYKKVLSFKYDKLQLHDDF